MSTLRIERELFELAALSLNEEEKQRFALKLQRVIAFIDQLMEVDLDALETATEASGSSPGAAPWSPDAARGLDLLRDDCPQKGLERAEALRSAPHDGDGFFRAPAPESQEARE